MSEYEFFETGEVPRLDGACKGMPVEWWFPEHPPTAEQSAQMNHAISICNGCKEKQICGDFAIDNPKVIGIWGGMGWKERQRVRTRRNRIAALKNLEEEKARQKKIDAFLKKRVAL
jgi:hypothetical protein